MLSRSLRDRLALKGRAALRRLQRVRDGVAPRRLLVIDVDDTLTLPGKGAGQEVPVLDQRAIRRCRQLYEQGFDLAFLSSRDIETLRKGLVPQLEKVGLKGRVSVYGSMGLADLHTRLKYARYASSGRLVPDTRGRRDPHGAQRGGGMGFRDRPIVVSQEVGRVDSTRTDLPLADYLRFKDRIGASVLDAMRKAAREMGVTIKAQPVRSAAVRQEPRFFFVLQNLTERQARRLAAAAQKRLEPGNRHLKWRRALPGLRFSVHVFPEGPRPAKGQRGNWGFSLTPEGIGKFIGVEGELMKRGLMGRRLRGMVIGNREDRAAAFHPDFTFLEIDPARASLDFLEKTRDLRRVFRERERARWLYPLAKRFRVGRAPAQGFRGKRGFRHTLPR